MFLNKRYESRSKQDLLEIYIEEITNMLCTSMIVVFVPLILVFTYLIWTYS